MATQIRPTAKIYAFPAGGRAAPGRYRDLTRPAHVAHFPRIEPTLMVDHPTSWYHEAAVEEETWQR